MEANKTYGEKAWRQLQRNTVSNIEQVLEAKPHKAATVRPPTTKTIKIRWTRHAGHCWNGFISDVLLWTPSRGQVKAGRSALTYIQQLCADTRCSPKDLPEAMDDWWGGERGSGISTLMAWHDDDDDDDGVVLFPLQLDINVLLTRFICVSAMRFESHR